MPLLENVYSANFQNLISRSTLVCEVEGTASTQRIQISSIMIELQVSEGQSLDAEVMLTCLNRISFYVIYRELLSTC